MADYRYTESGLDNVMIRGMTVPVDDAGEEVYSIPNVRGLHNVIVRCVITRVRGLSPKDIRFLRTEMGYTQAQLAGLLKKDHQTIGRWERGEIPMDQNAEFAIRMLAKDKLNIDTEMSIEDMLRSCVPSSEPDSIVIDGTDPTHYKPWQEAA